MGSAALWRKKTGNHERHESISTELEAQLKRFRLDR